MNLPIILNDKKEVVRLTNEEKHHASFMARQCFERFGSRAFNNALGYEVAITTLSTIVKRISEQKFFEVAPADFIPVRVGEGAWSSNLLTYRSYDMADAFESGFINVGSGRLSTPDAGVDSLTVQVFNWAKAIEWTIFDIELAAKSGNWDLIAAKEKSRKKNWDLGVQRIAFLGANGQNGVGGNCLGLLNQAGITVNSTLITQPISAMSDTQLATLQKGIVEAYRSNSNRTCFPSAFVIPESDYNGLAAQSSTAFPIKSKLQLLEEGFQVICRNKNFKILPLAYADVASSGGVLTKQTYVLLNYDEESIRMDVPVDYTNTLANSINNFQFSNVGYGQVTGCLAYRPLELLYLSYTP